MFLKDRGAGVNKCHFKEEFSLWAEISKKSKLRFWAPFWCILKNWKFEKMKNWKFDLHSDWSILCIDWSICILIDRFYIYIYNRFAFWLIDLFCLRREKSRFFQAASTYFASGGKNPDFSKKHQLILPPAGKIQKKCVFFTLIHPPGGKIQKFRNFTKSVFSFKI